MSARSSAATFGSTSGQRFLGRVNEVQFGAGEAPLLVVQLPVCATQNEVLVPYARRVCEEVRRGGKRIEMELPEGLLEWMLR